MAQVADGAARRRAVGAQETEHGQMRQDQRERRDTERVKAWGNGHSRKPWLQQAQAATLWCPLVLGLAQAGGFQTDLRYGSCTSP